MSSEAGARRQLEQYSRHTFLITSFVLLYLYHCALYLQDENLKLLKKSLATFGNQIGQVNENGKLKDLTSSAFDYLDKFKKVIFNVSVANAHLKLLESIQNCDPDHEKGTIFF
jgi:hypothetical protein